MARLIHWRSADVTSWLVINRSLLQAGSGRAEHGGVHGGAEAGDRRRGSCRGQGLLQAGQLGEDAAGSRLGPDRQSLGAEAGCVLGFPCSRVRRGFPRQVDAPVAVAGRLQLADGGTEPRRRRVAVTQEGEAAGVVNLDIA
jgi:hypothetical protein